MRVPALALVTRALRLEARALRPGLLRMVVVAFLVLTLFHSISFARWFGAPGQLFFNWLLNIDFFLITFLGVTMFPAVITEEKEGMTLGLLRLAGFDAISILLGKSAGQLLAALLLLGVQVPFAVLCITLGGVSSHQVFAAYAMLFAYLLFVFALALLCSVVCHRTFGSLCLALFSLALFLFGPVILEELLGGYAPSLVSEWVGASVWVGLERVWRTGYEAPLWNHVVTFHLALAAVLALTSWLLFERLNRREWRASQARGIWTRLWKHGRRTRPDRGAAAVAWKDYHFLGGGFLGIVVRIVAYAALWLVIAGLWPGRFNRFAIMVLLWTGLLLGLEGTFLASRVLKTEVKWGTLPALVLTPIPLRSWYGGKVRGAGAMLLPAMTSYLVAALAVFCSLPDYTRGEEVNVFLSTILYFSSWILVAMCLAVYLSLVVPRGGLAVTLGAVIGGNFLLILTMQTCVTSSDSATGMLFALSMVLLVAAFVLQIRVRDKIVEVAGR